MTKLIVCPPSIKSLQSMLAVDLPWLGSHKILQNGTISTKNPREGIICSRFHFQHSWRFLPTIPNIGISPEHPPNIQHHCLPANWHRPLSQAPPPSRPASAKHPHFPDIFSLPHILSPWRGSLKRRRGMEFLIRLQRRTSFPLLIHSRSKGSRTSSRFSNQLLNEMRKSPPWYISDISWICFTGYRTSWQDFAACPAQWWPVAERVEGRGGGVDWRGGEGADCQVAPPPTTTPLAPHHSLASDNTPACCTYTTFHLTLPVRCPQHNTTFIHLSHLVLLSLHFNDHHNQEKHQFIEEYWKMHGKYRVGVFPVF